ncbi:MAG: RNA-binding S4 domain-containing protein [Cyanobacteriota bacterium]|jgi:ribosomal 50S subunit-recycling heat shock protein
MRLDKWLKVSRIIKRRTIANEVCDKEKIIINGKIAKASSEVKINDIVEINMGNRKTVFEILSVPTIGNVTVQEAKEMYKMISSEKEEEI